VGTAIQDLAAARLGRSFLPCGLLTLAGGAWLALDGGASAIVLLLGAPATAVAMLAFVQRVVQRTFGRPRRLWMTVAAVGSIVATVYGVWGVGWVGLRGVATADGSVGTVAAILIGLAGVWLLREWTRVAQVQRLARVMSANMDEYGGSA
jgi:hypothetical protein